MNRFSVRSLLLTATLFSLISCGETKEFDDHANWKSRNSDFISQIAAKCSDKTPETASVGQLFRLLSYKLDPEQEWDNSSYVYCEILDKGVDTLSPYFSDSIRINYRVRLIPTDYYPEGQIVDRSFMTSDLNPTVNVPSSHKVSSLIEGVSTAIMHMHVGDFWKLYVPYGLAYGSNEKNDIPSYSALIFEINLTEIAPTGESLSPR